MKNSNKSFQQSVNNNPARFPEEAGRSPSTLPRTCFETKPSVSPRESGPPSRRVGQAGIIKVIRKDYTNILALLSLLAAFAVCCGGDNLREELVDYRDFLDKLAPQEAAAIRQLEAAAEKNDPDSFIESISSKTAPDLEAARIKLSSSTPENKRLEKIHQFHLQALSAYIKSCQLAVEGIVNDDRTVLAQAGQAAALGDRLVAEAKGQMATLLAEEEIEPAGQ
jgi:hypothetical protein